MMKLSLRQAADMAGNSKSTILRAIQKGRLSADRNQDGGWQIDPSELQRVYGDAMQAQTKKQAAGQDTPGDDPGGTAGTGAALQAQIDGLHAQLLLMKDQTVDLKDHAADLKDQRDNWQRQAERLLLSGVRSKRRWFGLVG